jgi:Domain of unknown function (DUF4402)
MKRIVKALVAVSAVAVSGNAYAATAQADAKAVILAPISITKTADLDFGTIAVNAGDTVTIANSADTASCGATAGNLICSGTTSRAKFNVAGVANASVAVTADGTVTLTRSGGTETMSVNLTTPSALATLSSTGAGTFNVTVNYN